MEKKKAADLQRFLRTYKCRKFDAAFGFLSHRLAMTIAKESSQWLDGSAFNQSW